MPPFEQQRHQAHRALPLDDCLVVACSPMRSNVNISGIARTAGASGVRRLILSGNAKLISRISRDGGEELSVDVHRSLGPILRKLRDDEGYRLVGLEQTTESQDLNTYRFQKRTVLVIGNERLGITEEILAELDDVIEIPVYGLPHSFNASSATAMALYEYRRQNAANASS